LVSKSSKSKPSQYPSTDSIEMIDLHPASVSNPLSSSTVLKNNDASWSSTSSIGSYCSSPNYLSTSVLIGIQSPPIWENSQVVAASPPVLAPQHSRRWSPEDN